MARKRTTTAPAVAEAPAEADRPDVFDEAIAAQQQPTTFAEKVGKKEYTPAPDPFGIASDYVAGVRLSESRRFRKMLLAFDEKPSQAVIDKLKESGFRWEPTEKVWTRELRDNPMTVRIEADRAFNEVSKMIRTERNIEHSAGVAVG